MKIVLIISIALLSSCQVSRPRQDNNLSLITEQAPSPSDIQNLDKILGNYLGYLKLPKREELLPLSFNITKKNDSEISAFITISHQDYKSTEYISENFNNLKLSQLDSITKIDFLGNSKNFKLSNTLAQNNTIIGKLILPDATEGSFEVIKQFNNNNASNHIFSKFQIAENISGRYISQCEQEYREIKLDLKNTKKTGNVAHNNLNFSGKMGFWQQKNCTIENKECPKITLSSINYNLATGNIDINSLEVNDSCLVVKNGIKCGECLYTKAQTTVIGKK